MILRSRRLAILSLLMITAAALFGCAGKSDSELERIITKEYEKSKGYVAICQLSLSNVDRTTDYTVKITSVFGEYTEISFLKPEHLKEFTLIYEEGKLKAKLNGVEIPLGILSDSVSAASILPENWLNVKPDAAERNISMEEDGKTAKLEMKLGKVKYEAHIDIPSGTPSIIEVKDETNKIMVCDYITFDYTR